MTSKQLDDLGMHTEDSIRWEVDPVCGMEVDPGSTQFHMSYKGKEYYFCNKSCYNHFRADTEKYIWDR